VVSKNTQTKKRFSAPIKILIGVVGFIAVIVLVIAYTLSGFGYTVTRLRCGHKPIVGVGTLGPTVDYITPENEQYKYFASNPGSKYYCTEAQAQADGLYKDLSSEESRVSREQARVAALLQNHPVSFLVYAPSTLPNGIGLGNATVETDGSVTLDFTENGLLGGYGYISQAPLGSDSDKRQWLCNNTTYPCQEIGKTVTGKTIYNVYYPGGNSTVWGVRFDSTYVMVLIYGKQKDAGINDLSIPQLFNSLKKIN